MTSLLRRLLIALPLLAMLAWVAYDAITHCVEIGLVNHRHGEAQLAFHYCEVLPGFAFGGILLILCMVFGWRRPAWLALAAFVAALAADQEMLWKFVLVDHLEVTASHAATHVVNVALGVSGCALAFLQARKGVMHP